MHDTAIQSRQEVSQSNIVRKAPCVLRIATLCPNQRSLKGSYVSWYTKVSLDTCTLLLAFEGSKQLLQRSNQLVLEQG